MYNHAVDCAGHEEKKIDGYGGWPKNYLRGQLRGNCKYQRENVDKDKNTSAYTDMDEVGNIIDFADTTVASWNSREEGNVPANQPMKEAIHLEPNLVSTEAMVHKEGQAKFKGLKMKTKLEN